MQKALLIAEKPDLMRKIEDVYRSNKSKIPYDITFTSQRGHLVTLLLPDEMDEGLKDRSWDTLPIEPETLGGWKYKIIDDKKVGNFLTSKERYAQIKKEIDSGNYNFIIHAGDPDQEGELLVRLVLAYAKNTLPVKRFWTNDLTEAHILNALQNLKDDDTDAMLTNLLDAAYARQHSDWRYGMNISRAASLKMNAPVACGRVKTPILAIVCKREEEIRNFKPSTCYGIKAEYDEKFDGIHFDIKAIVSDDENASEDQKNGTVWFETKQEAEDLIKTLGKQATVAQFNTKRVETYAPKLYKLATAQIDAGKKGYNDAATLETIQKLYEQEYLSYPRTDCEYLSSDEDFDGILEALGSLSDFNGYVNNISADDIDKVRHSKKWINDKALQESGHSALRPTTKVPTLSALSAIEKDIYEMIVKRFIAIFLPPIVQDKTVLVSAVGDKLFRSNGKTLIDPGFSKIFGTTFTDMQIPVHQKGDILNVDKYTITEKTTTCPKRYTSPDLIAVCENPLKFLDDPALKHLGKKLKIGTPATRSGIIRQLIDKQKYLAEKKEKKTTYLVPTPEGEAIIKNLNGLQICRVDMTGLWEEELEKIRSGENTLSNLETQMRQNVREMIDEIKAKEMTVLASPKQRNVVGTCPACGKDVLESEKGIYCSGYKSGCKIGIFKTAYGLEFNLDNFMTVASGNQIQKGNRSFYYDKENAKLMEIGDTTDIPCPFCKKNLSETDQKYFCSCGFSLNKVLAGHALSAHDVSMIGAEGHTDFYDDFQSKTGKNFRARLKLENKKLSFEFEQPEFTETEIKCPCCKKGKMKKSEKKWYCDCGFTIWKTIAQREITEAEVEDICANGTSPLLDGFTSKKNTEFSCYLVVNKRKKELDMKFDKKKK